MVLKAHSYSLVIRHDMGSKLFANHSETTQLASGLKITWLAIILPLCVLMVMWLFNLFAESVENHKLIFQNVVH